MAKIKKLANSYALGAAINGRVTSTKVDELIDIVNGDEAFPDNMEVEGDLSVRENLTVELDVDVTGTVTADGGFATTGNVEVDGTLYSKGDIFPLSADGAVSITGYDRTLVITKGSACALTIADPTTGTHDGIEMTFIATTAHAHTLDNSAGSGFNAGGAASDVATFGGARGDNITIVAYQGKWYVKSKTNVTLA
jgi:hypothetical protein